MYSLIKKENKTNTNSLLKKPAILILLVGLSSGLLFVPVTLANNNSGPPATNWHTWHEHIRHQPTPGTGCFEANYPNPVWQRIKCGPPSTRHYEPSSTATASSMTVGSGNDYVAQSPSGTFIGSAYGGFPYVNGLTSETDSILGKDAYSLQLNSNFFQLNFNGYSTTGVEQFVFDSQEGVLIEYWLKGYSDQYLNGGPCQGLPGLSSTETWRKWGGDCVLDAKPVPTQSVPATNLKWLNFEGIVNKGIEEAQLCIVGGNCYSNSQRSVIDLDQHWTNAEFNIFGIGGGSQAQFNPGTSITIENELADSTNTPIWQVSPCQKGGITAETNNLNLWGCRAGQGQAGIFFDEDNIDTRTYTFQTYNNLGLITVDGTSYNSPYTVSWKDGITHTVSVPSTLAITSWSQYWFTGWEGMSTSKSPSISITAGGNTAGIYTSGYLMEYYLTVDTDPVIYGYLLGGLSGWYGSDATIEAPNRIGTDGSYVFSTWKIDGSPVSGNPISVWMNAPHTATAVYINTPSGTGIVVNPGSGVSVMFTGVTIGGDTTVETSTINPGSNPAGFQFLGTYYDITTTASYTPPVAICLPYDPTGMTLAKQNALQIQHWDSNTLAWVDVTKSVDTTKHTICGQVNSLSPFGIAEKLGSISGMKFNDLNGNGLLDKGESGLNNWSIALTNDTGYTITQQTAQDGSYNFTNLTDGNYTVGEVLQSGWTQTAPAASSTGSTTYKAQIAGGNSVTGDDFGNFKFGSISGMKFQDLDANGVLDSGEVGLADWNITINGNQTTTTDSSGNYNFTGLTAGNYAISEILQPGWIQAAPQTGNYAVTITSGAEITGQDFGNFHKGNITGGGNITGDTNASFGIVGHYPDGSNKPQGIVEYLDHKANLNIKSIQINSVASTLDLKKGEITGIATVNGKGSYPFSVYVEDNAEPGIGADIFKISLTTYPYLNGAILSGGNIQIHS